MKRIFLSLFCMAGLYAYSQQAYVAIPKGHTELVEYVLFSPDGKYLLSSGRHEMILWDARSGRQIRNFDRCDEDIYHIQFSPNRTHFVTTGHGNKATIWSIASNSPLKDVGDGQNPMQEAVFSSDGMRLFAGGEKRVVEYDFPALRATRTFNFEVKIDRLAPSPDGAKLLVGLSDRTIKVMDLILGKDVLTFTGHQNDKRAFSGIWRVLVLPDSKTAISMAYYSPGNHYLLWDVNTGAIVYQSKVNTITDIKLSYDGNYALLRKGYTSTSYILNTTSNHIADSVKCYAMHPDNKTVAYTYGWDVHTYDIQRRSIVQKFESYSNVFDQAWVDGKGSFYAIGRFNAHVFKAPVLGKSRIESVSVYPYSYYKTEVNDKVLISRTNESDNTVALGMLDLATREKKEFATKFKYNGLVFNEQVYDISADCRYVLFFERFVQDNKDGHNCQYKLFDTQADRVVKVFEYGNPYNEPYPRFWFAPDGKSLVSINYPSSGDVYRWKTSSLKPDREMQNPFKGFDSEKEQLLLSFAADGRRMVAGNRGGRLVLFDLERGAAVSEIGKVSDYITSLRISNDGRFVAVGNQAGAIALIDVTSAKTVATMKGHQAKVNDVRFCADGRAIISTSDDNTTRFWDYAGHELFSMVYFKSGDFVAITPDGRFDGTDKGLERLQIVKGLDLFPLESLFDMFYTPGLVNLALSGKLGTPVATKLADVDVPTGKEGVNLIDVLQPAPVVSIVSPQDGFAADRPTAEISVKAIDMGGGVDEIKLYHNSKLIETSGRGFKAVVAKGAEVLKTFQVNLVSGKNVFTAKATNLQSTESMPDIINVTYDANRPTASLYLLAVGINQYKNSTYNLNYAIPDAMAFVDIIGQKTKSIFSKVHINFVKDAEATRERILEVFNSIKQNTAPDDVFVFYYAGHGVMSDEDKPQFYLACHNVTKLYGDPSELFRNGISAIELQTLSREIKAQKQLFVLDACQSGGMVELLAQRGAAEEKAIAQLARSTGTYWFTASGSDQFASEFRELGHGVFTYGLLEGLSCKADGGDKDAKITVKELSAYLEDLIPELTQKYKGRSQYPRLYGFGQDFPVVTCR